MNRKFLADANVGLVINTAGGLKDLFPTFKTDELYGSLSVTALPLDWQDTESQAIGGAELDEAIAAILSTLSEGRSVLVHCAQGKSRSSTVVVAYVSQIEQLSIDDALRFVQSKRNMAQPNSNFMAQLQEWRGDVVTFDVGAEVEALREDGRWFAAKIEAVLGGKKFMVAWSDGEVEGRVHLQRAEHGSLSLEMESAPVCSRRACPQSLV